jgi:hypothetical protein
VRIIIQPLADGFELCARLGLVFLSDLSFGGKVIHSVLGASPSARAGIEPRDIVFAVHKAQWDSVRYLTFSDRRPSELSLKVFVARYFTVAYITVRVPPEPYRPMEEILAEAIRAVAGQSARLCLRSIRYVNPRHEWFAALTAARRRTQRRRRS